MKPNLKQFFRSSAGETIEDLTVNDIVPTMGMLNRTLTVKSSLEARFHWIHWNVVYTRNVHHGEMELLIVGITHPDDNDPIELSGYEYEKFVEWAIDKGDNSVCCDEAHLGQVVSDMILGIKPNEDLLTQSGVSWKRYEEKCSEGLAAL